MDNTTKLIGAFGITSSLFAAGFYFSSSYIAVPPLLALPAKLSTAAFVDVYYRGIGAVVPLTVLSTIATGTVALLVPEKRLELGAAAVCTIAAMPWTLVMMMKTNNRLIGLKDATVEREKVGEKGVNELLQKWKVLNTVRAGFPLVGGAIGLWALVN